MKMNSDLREVIETIERTIKHEFYNIANHRQDDPDELLNEKEASKILGVKQQTMGAWRHHCKGPAYIKIGTNVRYQRSAIKDFIKARAVRTSF